MNGGTLTLGRVTGGYGSGTFDFGGGTLRPAASTTAFMRDLTDAYVQRGGAAIDTAGYNVTIAQPLLHDPLLGTSPDGGLTKVGTGLLTLTGANTYAGPTTVTAGGLQLAYTATLASGSTVVSSATLELLAAPAGTSAVAVRSLSDLTLKAGGSAVVDAPPTPAARQLLVAPTLTFAGTKNAWQGTLDLTGNDLDVPSGTLATVANQVAEGYAGGTWAGAGGIVSSAAAADARQLTALGVIGNDQGGTPLYTAAHPFDGTTAAAADVLAKYTYYGDADLDGVVNGADYARIDAGYASQSTANKLTGWT